MSLLLFAQVAETAKTAAAKTAEAAKTGAEKVAEKTAELAEAGKDAASQAAETADAASSFPWLDEMLNTGALGLLIQGGFFMWVILVLGVIVLGVIIERYRSLKMLATDTGELQDEVLDLLRQDRVGEALDLCDQEQGPVPAVLGHGIRKYLMLRKLGYDAARVEEQVVKAMDDYSVHIVAALERHLPILATIASAAPMLGFLGTVQGMIISFNEIVAEMGNKNIVEAAAGGISVALLTTCFGLIIGIPAYVAFNYFSSVINRFVLDTEQASTELMETVTMQLAVEEGEQMAKVKGKGQVPNVQQ